MREEILGIDSSICVERAELTTAACRKYESSPVVLKRAHILDTVCGICLSILMRII